MKLLRILTRHPTSGGQTYGAHMCRSFAFSGHMLLAGAACIVHAILPFLFVHTASREVEKLHDRLPPLGAAMGLSSNFSIAGPGDTRGMRWEQLLPGIALALVLALAVKSVLAAAGAWNDVPLPVSPVLCAVVLGIFWRNFLGVASRFETGLRWVMHTLLRIGIALVGLKLTLTGVTQVAGIALPVVIGCIMAALLAGWIVSRALGVPGRMAQLLAVGTAVCGCTAVIAMSPAIRARHHETAFALACVVTFGCIGMLVQPWIAHEFFADSVRHAGVLLGTSIHDTSQVIGAALIYSQQYVAPDALGAASVTKVMRNLSIGILIPAAAWWALREERRTRSAAQTPSAQASIARGTDTGKTEQPPLRREVALPLFVVFFVLLIAARSAGDALTTSMPVAQDLWSMFLMLADRASELLLLCGVTAVGLSVSLVELRIVGWRPLCAGAIIAIVVAVTSLGLTLVSYLARV